jgi:hypothetical protein
MLPRILAAENFSAGGFIPQSESVPSKTQIPIIPFLRTWPPEPPGWGLFLWQIRLYRAQEERTMREPDVEITISARQGLGNEEKYWTKFP